MINQSETVAAKHLSFMIAFNGSGPMFQYEATESHVKDGAEWQG
jgi:hypothetical protein